MTSKIITISLKEEIVDLIEKERTTPLGKIPVSVFVSSILKRYFKLNDDENGGDASK